MSPLLGVEPRVGNSDTEIIPNDLMSDPETSLVNEVLAVPILPEALKLTCLLPEAGLFAAF